MKEDNKRKSKLKLDELPSVYERDSSRALLKVTELTSYSKYLKAGYRGFTEKELKRIEKQYADGITFTEIEHELKKKGMKIKESTIRHYIKTKIVPKSTKRKKDAEKPHALYPANFLRHLNYVRFALEMGREKYKKIEQQLELIFLKDIDLLEESCPDTGYDYGFFQLFNTAVQRMEDGLHFAEKAVEEAFKDYPKKRKKYLKYLKKLESPFQNLKEEIKLFSDDAEESKFWGDAEPEKVENTLDKLFS